MIRKFVVPLSVAALLAVGGLHHSAAARPHDIVIEGGRVLDPETGLDAIRNIGINDGKIVAVSEHGLEGSRVIDASGLIVSPGFIDLHAHGQDILSARVQAFDGVTTALDLEAGMLPIDAFYSQAEAEGRPINYGASVNWANARISVFLGQSPVANLNWFLAAFKHPIWQRKIASPEQFEKIKGMVREGIEQGGLGIGMLLGYAPGTGHKEFFEMNRLAAEYGVPTFTHARFLSMLEPNSSFQGMSEIVSASAGTGAHTHISHLNSISLRDIPAISGLIRNAQKHGLKVTTEAYPYGAGSTGIGAAMFRGDKWRERAGGIDATSFDVGGKRLTEEEFDYYQREKPETATVVHFFEEEDEADSALLDKSVLFPGGVIASDGVDWRVDGQIVPQATWPLPANAWGHPRSAGTFARFLRKYVREKQSISLMEAIRRMSFGPAAILQTSVPQMQNKGRIQAGADADIVIFDMETVSDQATYAKPAQLSAGFDYVIVNGVILIDSGVLEEGVLPGKPVRNRTN